MKPPQGWLPATEAYYTPPPPVNVKTPDGDRPSAETMMQVLVQEHLSRPNGFYFGSEPKPPQLLQQFTDYAKTLTTFSWSMWTTVGFNPTASAVFYANVLMETLKRIPATMADGMANPDASLFDVWITR